MDELLTLRERDIQQLKRDVADITLELKTKDADCRALLNEQKSKLTEYQLELDKCRAEIRASKKRQGRDSRQSSSKKRQNSKSNNRDKSSGSLKSTIN